MKQSLLKFLDNSPLAFHAAVNIIHVLKKNGFTELKEQEAWELSPGGSYFVQRNDSSLIALKIGENISSINPFHIALSHLDSPGLRLKMHSMKQSGNTLVVPVERYSANIDSTWLDHPLTVAGRVILKNMQSRIIAFKDSMAVIPNIAIHMNRDVNHGFAYNPQTQLSAMFGSIEPMVFLEIIAQEAHCTVEDIAELELGLVDATPAAIVGIDGSLVNSPRLDNLLAAHAMLTALQKCKTPDKAIDLAFFADNEEIGNNTMAGADSNFLRDTMLRTVLALGGSCEDAFRSQAASTLISIDAAHAFHPNFPEKSDPTTSAFINEGIVLKFNPNGRYVTNGQSAAWFASLCNDLGLNLQRFAMRADMPCGSTVGPTTSAALGIQGVDVGNPLWAMHSVRETGGLSDQKDMIKLLTHYFS